MYKDFGTNYLNQDHILISRRLETSDLQIYAQTYQDSSDLYISFCDSISRLFYKTNPHIIPPSQYADNRNFTIIVSPTKYPLAQAAAVCKTLGARLPEIKTRLDNRDFLEAVDKYQVKTVLAGIHYNIKSSVFLWDSNLVEVAHETVYSQPYYGGSSGEAWLLADNWYSYYLKHNAQNYYMTYVRAKDGIAFRLSDSITPNNQEHIVCQKPVPSLAPTADPSANILIQMTKGICSRDSQFLIETTQQNIEQIELITTLKLNLTTSSVTLAHFLPSFQTDLFRDKREISFTLQTSSNSTAFPTFALPENSSSPPPPPILLKHNNYNISENSTCIRLTNASTFWSVLAAEFTFQIPSSIFPPLSSKISLLVENSFAYWIHLQTTNQTYSSYHTWLDEQMLEKRIIVCNYLFSNLRFTSDRRLYSLYPKVINRYRYSSSLVYLEHPQNPFDFIPTDRTTRSLGSMAAATVVGTLVGGSAYIIKSFIDLLRTDKYALKTDFTQLKHTINDLRINQAEIQTALQRIIHRVNVNEANIRQLYSGVAATNMEAEIKSLNHYLQGVLSNTLQGYAQAFLAAMSGKTSPYALSQKELNKIALDFHEKYTLDTNINNVRTTAVIFENSIRFFFDIPILDKEAAFNFYSITPAPIFYKNITYWPEIDATNVAISLDGTKYSTLSQNEFARCMDVPPICKTSTPFSPSLNKASCVISTYKTNTRTCPLKPSSSIPFPFLYFIDTHLFYSVPTNTSLFITCPTDSQFSTITEKTVIINGIGEANYRPACTITLPDGTFRRAPRKTEHSDLKNWPLFNIKSALPHDFDEQIMSQTQLPPLTFDVITNISNDLSSFIANTSSFANYSKVAINISTVVVPVAIVIIVALCFWKQLKIWVEEKIYQGTHTLNRHTETAKDEFKYAPSTTSVTQQKTDTLKSQTLVEPIFDQSSGSYQKVSSIGSIPSILKNSSTPKNVQFRYHP